MNVKPMMKMVLKNNRRTAILGGGCILTLASLPFLNTNKFSPSVFVSRNGDRQWGKIGMKVIMFSSVGCPFCIKWENNYFNHFVQQYVKTNKVVFILRDSPRNHSALLASAFLTAFSSLDDYFSIRQRMHVDMKTVLLEAQNGKLGSEGAEATRRMNDTDFVKQINEEFYQDIRTFGIGGTPTFCSPEKRSVLGAETPEYITRKFDI